MKYKVTVDGKTIEVWIDATKPNQRAPIQYSEDNQNLRGWLESEYGAFGHVIGGATSQIDLHYAMGSKAAEKYKPELIEGTIDKYDPDIPDGSVT